MRDEDVSLKYGTGVKREEVTTGGPVAPAKGTRMRELG